MTDSLIVARSGHRTTLTLNRPERVNALDAALVEALLAALATAARDGTRIVVFRGAGKGFSAGFDFSGLDTQSDGDLVLRFIRLEQVLQAVWSAPFVTMAVAHGPCFGAAADLMASCAIRIASDDASFRMPGLRFGIALGTARLARVIGTDAARSLLTTSRIFDAAEAQRIGFLTAIAEPGRWPELIDAATEDAAMLPDASLDRMLRLTRTDTGAADLAELVASLTEPGLKQRITAYLASLKRRG